MTAHIKSLMAACLIPMLAAPLALAEVDQIPQSETIDLLRPAISPTRKLPRTDMVTGEIVADDAMIHVLIPGPDGQVVEKLVRAGDYYSKLDEIEAKLNKLGYSLMNESDAALIGEISMLKLDELLLERQMQETAKRLLATDDATMATLKNPEKILADLRSEGEQKAQDFLDDIWRKAAENGLELPSVKIPELTPVAVPQPDAELNSFLTKAWAIEHGEENRFKAKAELSLDLKGSLKQVYGRAYADASVWAFQKRYSLASGSATATAFNRDGFGGNANAEVKFLGKSVWSWSVKDSDNLRRADTSIKTPDGGLSPIGQAVKQSYPFGFMLGPIPVEGEVGIAGLVDYELGFGYDEAAVSTSFVPILRTQAFANIAATAYIAKVGAEGNLTILDTRLTFEGEANLQSDAANDQPKLNFDVNGHSDMTVLDGRIYAFAQVMVPKISPPFYEPKRWEHTLYKWDGILAAEERHKVLFNFGKEVTKDGYSLYGAPQSEDVAEVNVDAELNAAFEKVSQTLSAPEETQSVAEARQSLQVLAAIKADIQDLVDHFKTH